MEMVFWSGAAVFCANKDGMQVVMPSKKMNASLMRGLVDGTNAMNEFPPNGWMHKPESRAKETMFMDSG